MLWVVKKKLEKRESGRGKLRNTRTFEHFDEMAISLIRQIDK